MPNRGSIAAIARLLAVSLCLGLALPLATAAGGCRRAAPGEQPDGIASPLQAPLGPEAVALFLREAGMVLWYARPGGCGLPGRDAAAEAESWLARAKSLAPDNPYATYLEGVIAGTFRDDPGTGAARMRAVVDRLPGQPEAARQLAIYEAARGGGPRPAEIYQFLGPTESFALGGMDHGAVWSPNGRRVAVVVRSGLDLGENRAELTLVDRATTRITRLNAGLAVHPVAWSSDGQWLYYVDGGLKRVAWDGRDVTTLAPRARDATLSPDGLRLAFWSKGISVVDAAAGIVTAGDGGRTGKAWWAREATESTVQVTTGEGDHSALWLSDSRRFLYAKDTGMGGGDSAHHEQVLAWADASLPGSGKVLRSEPEPYSRLTWLVPDEAVGATVDGLDCLVVRLDATEVDLRSTMVGEWDKVYWLPGTGAARVTGAPQDFGDGGVWTLHVLDCGGRELRSALLAGFGTNPNLSTVGGLFCPDGRPASTFIVDCLGPDGSSLWVLSPERLEPRLVAVGDDGLVTVSPDGAWVAVFTGRALNLYPTSPP